jgi:outer membrane lipoprotein-sorting protein
MAAPGRTLQAGVDPRGFHLLVPFMNTMRFLGCSIVLLALTAAGFGAPKTFDGKVRFAMTTDRGPASMTYLMKGGLIRMEIEAEKGQTGVILLDFAQHEMTMLVPQQKMYMVHPLPDPAKTEPGAPGAAAQPDVQLTGQYETILGYKCEKIIVKSRDNVTEIWGAEGLGVYMNPGMGGPGRGRSAPSNAWEAELASRGYFPLRVVTHDASGKENFKMEATEIDPSTPDDSLFVPPPDYQKFEMPAIPGMGGMNPFKR